MKQVVVKISHSCLKPKLKAIGVNKTNGATIGPMLDH